MSRRQRNFMNGRAFATGQITRLYDYYRESFPERPDGFGEVLHEMKESANFLRDIPASWKGEFKRGYKQVNLVQEVMRRFKSKLEKEESPD